MQALEDAKPLVVPSMLSYAEGNCCLKRWMMPLFLEFDLGPFVAVLDF